MESKDIKVDKLEEETFNKIIESIEDTEQLSDDKYALKELLTGKDNIKFKTELSMEQIKAITQILAADMIVKAASEHDKERGEAILNTIPDMVTSLVMQLMVSKKRLGRTEFISAFRGKKEANKPSLFGGGWRNNEY